MQENNNFETIISTWRRLSGEQIETAVVSMSGDSSEHPHKKKEEEVDLLVPERNKASLATSATAGAALATAEAPAESTGASNEEEKKGFIQYDKEDSKEAAGDTNEKAFKNDKNDDYLENDKEKSKSEKQDKAGDNVDSVYLRPPPPHKARSNTSTVDEEDCGIKCLYYTLQCCDCVLM